MGPPPIPHEKLHYGPSSRGTSLWTVLTRHFTMGRPHETLHYGPSPNSSRDTSLWALPQFLKRHFIMGPPPIPHETLHHGPSPQSSRDTSSLALTPIPHETLLDGPSSHSSQDTS
nr:hypothetical protein BgiMline_008200 [Biomphalaria glabrata]